MKRDLLFTFLIEFIVLTSGLLVYKFAFVFLGQDGFSEYSISRRTVSLINPAILMGLGVAIPRYIAIAAGKGSQKNTDTYFVGGLFALFFSGLICTVVMQSFKGTVAFIFFGNSGLLHLVLPINLMLLGLLLHATCYCYYRGQIQMGRANLIQLANMGLVPILVFAFVGSTREVLLLTGLLWMGVSSFFMITILRSIKWGDLAYFSAVKEILFYGFQRVPGDFGMAALLALPATFTAHNSGVVEAGYVAFGMSLMIMTGSVFSPFGLILLPKISQAIAKKDFEFLKHIIEKLVKITILVTIFGVAFFEVFADVILKFYLGEEVSKLILISRIIMLGSCMYTVYISLRSVIDAYYIKSKNTKNILITLSALLFLFGIAELMEGGFIYIVSCTVVSMFLLGILTLIEIKKIQKEIGSL